MPEIFLSYRRQDTDHALSLYMWLIKRYGRDAIFWDQKNIDAGRDFAEILAQGIEKSVAFIALIGPEWLAADSAGHRRIDSPDDWVRRETSSALDRRMLVIPVLGSGARMPAAKDLPDELKRFSRLQALSIADMRFYRCWPRAWPRSAFTRSKAWAPTINRSPRWRYVPAISSGVRPSACRSGPRS